MLGSTFDPDSPHNQVRLAARMGARFSENPYRKPGIQIVNKWRLAMAAEWEGGWRIELNRQPPLEEYQAAMTDVFTPRLPVPGTEEDPQPLQT